MTRAEATFLELAARLAVRGHGGAEPNPLVGCVVVAPDAAIVGWGFHRRCGEDHAEIAALRRAGAAASGSTAYVTLEPCNHTGRTGPCSEALIRAGVRRVVYARDDPHPQAGGGATRLRSAGIEVSRVPCAPAERMALPFIHRTATSRPWVIAKWAQTIDGRIATRSGDSKWISGARSRRLVHRERGRVDAILSGIGTIRADDAQLTARRVRRRRIARRVVVDPRLSIDSDARLLADLDTAPVSIACDRSSLDTDAAATLRARGVDLIGLAPAADGDLPLDVLLERLAGDHGVGTVLVEAGPGLLGRLWRQRLVNEAWVFTGPRLLGDDDGLPSIGGAVVERIADAASLRLVGLHRREDDVFARYLFSAPKA